MRTGTLVIVAVAGVLLVAAAGVGAYNLLDSGPAVSTTAAPAAPQKAPAASSKATPSPSSAGAEPSGPAEASAPPTKTKASIISGTADNDTLRGTDGDDRIYAATETDAQGSDVIDAGPGDDRIYADAGDTVQGGTGHDELIVRGAAGFHLALAGAGIEETWGGDGADFFDGSGVGDEPLTLRGGEGKDDLMGGKLDDTLFGGPGDDVLEGGPGNDILKGEAGDDILTGGPGADFFSYAKYDGSTDIVTDYSFADGDSVTATKFAVHGADSWLLDDAGHTLFVLKNYDASVSGVARRR